jgi:hypothetical protein
METIRTESEQLSKLNYYLEGAPFGDTLDVLAYDRDNHAFITLDGRFCRVFSISNIPEDQLSQAEKFGISNAFSRIISEFPEGAYGQYIRFTHSDIQGSLYRFGQNIAQGDFTHEIARSIASRQMTGARSGFFSTISTEMAEQAIGELTLSIDDIEVRDNALVSLETMHEGGNKATVTEQFLIFMFVPDYGAKFERRNLKYKIREFLNGDHGSRKELFEREFETFMRYCENIQKRAKSEHMLLRALTGQGLVNLLFRELNPTRYRYALPPKYDPNRTIREIVLGGIPEAKQSMIGHKATFTNVMTSPRGLKIEDYHYRVTSLKASPSYTEPGMLYEIMKKVEGEGWVAINFAIKSQFWHRASIRFRKQILNNHVKLGKKVELLAPDEETIEEKRRDFDHVMTKTNPEGREPMKMIDTSVFFVCIDKDEGEAERRTRELEDLLWSQGYKETLRGDAIIHHTLPLNLRPRAFNVLQRNMPMVAENFSDLLPLYTGYQGVSDARLMFNNSQGQPIFIDPFSDKTTAPHGLWVGTTGVGKSFAHNNFLMQMYVQYKPKMILIDKGDSYESLVEVLNGEYVRLTISEEGGLKPLCINPFYVAPSKEGIPRKPTQNECEYIRGILVAMIKSGAPSEVVDKEDLTLLLDAIIRLFEKRHHEGELTLSDYIQELEKSEGIETERAIRLRNKLREYFGNGVYSNMFDGKLGLNWDNDIICFEIGRIDKSAAMPVCMLVLFYQIEQYVKFKLPFKQKKCVSVDEAWKILSIDFLASEFSGYYRELRKYNCSVNLISQSVKDFAALATADKEADEGVLDNTKHLYFLPSNTKDRRFAKDLLDFTDEDIHAWESLKALPPFFTEMLYVQRRVGGNNGGKVRIFSAPLPLWISSTQPDDRALRAEIAKKFIAEGLDPKEAKKRAIIELAGRYPYGSKYKFRNTGDEVLP